MSAGAPLLAVDHLSRVFGGGGLLHKGPRVCALDDISLTIAHGEVLGIVGGSGSGKSTLARLVMALDRPTSGRIRFEGQDLATLPPAKLARLRPDFQMVFQDPYASLDPRHRVGRIVAEPLHLLHPQPDRAARRERVAEMLTNVGLAPTDADRYPHEFSGGQRQRIAIARALITRPKLLVADEAVSALDLLVQAQVLNLLMDLQERENLAILFISHDLAAVEAISDRIGVMYQGRLVEIGPAHRVLGQPHHAYTQRLIEAEPTLSAVRPSAPLSA
ncbi:ATP-binding cassette domain-containing protein [Consotaella aegiceratis]|uniref:ATP-binding cassette domain-containing protein n=1 Tax=Consotaella aegiceratis TaxID=3097961 RepID=UPI002F42A1B8